jgi:hypothetical protein
MAMTISLDRPAIGGDRRLEPGTYRVAVDENIGVLRLTAADLEYELPAMRRPSKVQVRRPSIQLRKVGGEPRWLLVARMPPAFEWTASLDYAAATEGCD